MMPLDGDARAFHYAAAPDHRETEPMIERTFLFDDDLEDPVDTTETDRLAVANSKLPHLRLGQLIINALWGTGAYTSHEDVGRALFYMTDEQLAAVVERYVERADKL